MVIAFLSLHHCHCTTTVAVVTAVLTLLQHPFDEAFIAARDLDRKSHALYSTPHETPGLVRCSNVRASQQGLLLSSLLY